MEAAQAIQLMRTLASSP